MRTPVDHNIVHLSGLTDALALGSKPSITFWMALGLLAALPQVTDIDSPDPPAYE